MSKIKVLVVDDSAFMRSAIEKMLSQEPDVEIIATARNGEEAVDMAARLQPDVITMDIEMPKMSGLEALEIIMRDNPRPVIMVSSLTKEGADATLKALDLGAVDFIAKNTSSGIDSHNIEMDLRSKIKKFANNKSMMRLITARKPLVAGGVTVPPPVLTQRVQTKEFKDSAAANKKVLVSAQGHKRIVALGTSTGGPQSLQKVIPLLPADIGVPIVITQHMPPNFTQSLAARLNSLSKLEVVEVADKQKIEPNVVYIAKGGLHFKFKKVASNIYADLSPEPTNYFNIPAVDVMVSSITEIFGGSCLGVIMTGMGADGTKGLQELKEKKGMVIAQNEASCIVYGMPRSVIEAGLADEIVPLEDIASRIVYHCRS